MKRNSRRRKNIKKKCGGWEDIPDQQSRSWFVRGWLLLSQKPCLRRKSYRAVQTREIYTVRRKAKRRVRDENGIRIDEWFAFYTQKTHPRRVSQLRLLPHNYDVDRADVPWTSTPLTIKLILFSIFFSFYLLFSYHFLKLSNFIYIFCKKITQAGQT